MTVAICDVWLDARAAARLLQVDPRQIPRFAAEGKIATRNLPVRAKYRAADVIELARLGSRPAASA